MRKRSGSVLKTRKKLSRKSLKKRFWKRFGNAFSGNSKNTSGKFSGHTKYMNRTDQSFLEKSLNMNRTLHFRTVSRNLRTSIFTFPLKVNLCIHFLQIYPVESVRMDRTYHLGLQKQTVILICKIQSSFNFFGKL